MKKRTTVLKVLVSDLDIGRLHEGLLQDCVGEDAQGIFIDYYWRHVSTNVSGQKRIHFKCNKNMEPKSFAFLYEGHVSNHMESKKKQNCVCPRRQIKCNKK